MSRTFHSALLPRLVALVAALLLGAFAVVVTSSPARAHDELLGSDPAAGSTVDALPAELRLTLSGAIAAETGASEVQVTDASGAALVDGAPTTQDNVLTQPLTGEASGVITVLWKVVSSDGHPISGEFSFAVSASAAPTATGDPTPSESVAPTETATPAPTQEPTTPADGASDSADIWPWILLAVLALAVIAAVVWLLVSRGRRDRRPGDAPGSTPDDGPRPGSEPPAAH